MTTKEYLLDKAWREGFEEGREEGLVEGREEGRLNLQKETIEHLIIGLNYSDLQIMEILRCSEEFLAQIRSDLESRKS